MISVGLSAGLSSWGFSFVSPSFFSASFRFSFLFPIDLLLQDSIAHPGSRIQSQIQDPGFNRTSRIRDSIAHPGPNRTSTHGHCFIRISLDPQGTCFSASAVQFWKFLQIHRQFLCMQFCLSLAFPWSSLYRNGHNVTTWLLCSRVYFREIHNILSHFSVSHTVTLEI